MVEYNAPGVYITETDNSFIRREAVVVGTALIGPTPAGPPLVPTVVTSYEEYKAKFGTTFASGSYYYEYFTSITAKNYFDNGGDTLLVTRIVSGSGATLKTYASSSVAASGSTVAFTLQVNDFGSIYNGATSSYGRKWEIPAVDTTRGTFSLNIRRGDDTNTNKIILESFTGLSLDPMLPNYIARVLGDTTTYYDSVTNSVLEEGSFVNKSQYVRVKTVDSPIIDSIDVDGVFRSAFSYKLPLVGTSGSFAGGTDGVVTAGPHNFFEKITGAPTNVQGFTAEPYLQAISLLSNPLEFKFKVLAIPGISPDNASMSTVIAALNGLAQDRDDFIAIVDPAMYGANDAAMTNAVSSLDNNKLTAYGPWLQTYSLNLGRAVWVPASVFIPGVYKFNDLSAAEWWAPAGFNRGGIPTAIKAERKLSQQSIANLLAGNVNPIATFPGNGLVVWGQNTLQKRDSYMKKVNVVRLVINLGEFMNDVAKYIVFDPNSNVTRNNFKNKVNPYFEQVRLKEGLYAYSIVMDESNNTSDVIDRFELVGQIIIQPTLFAEKIRLNINVSSLGVTITPAN